MSACVSLFHSYVSLESEYRNKSDGPLKKRTILSINTGAAECHVRSFHVFKQVHVYFTQKLHGTFNFNRNQLTCSYEFNHIIIISSSLPSFVD